MRRQPGLILPAVLLCAGVIYALVISAGYEKGRLEYARLESDYTAAVQGEGELQDTHSDIPSFAEGEAAQALPPVTAEEVSCGLPPDAPKRIDVDWAGLQAENADVTGWILVPAAGISYPVLQGETNETYLHRDISGTYLFAGSIFLDSACAPDLRDYNTVIYGHNMRDGSMFAGLKELQDEDVLASCRYFWVLLPGRACLYEIFAVRPASPGSDTYLVRFSGARAHRTWAESMRLLSLDADGADLTERDRVVTLSTCTAQDTVRLVVQGRLVYMEDT